MEFWEHAKVNAKKHRQWGKNYFVFTKGVWDSISDFAIGQFMYANWLIWQDIRNNLPVIYAKNDVMAIHQNHEYNTNNFSGEKSENKKLFGNAWNFGIQDATHELVEDFINRKNTPDEISWYLYCLRRVYHKWKWLIIIYSKLYRLFNYYLLK